jgi:hypothetical protein
MAYDRHDPSRPLATNPLHRRRALSMLRPLRRHRGVIAPKSAILLTVLATLLLTLAGTSSALAVSPWWHLSVNSRPTNLPLPTEAEGVLTPGEGQIVLTASNVGDAAATGAKTPLRITDELPEGLKATSLTAIAETVGSGGSFTVVPCKKEGAAPNESLSCTFEGNLPAYGLIEVHIGVAVGEGAASGAIDRASISGGGAQSISISQPLKISDELAPFGVENYEMTPEEEGGSTDSQAGSHPFQLRTALTLNQTADENPVALTKDLNFNLPAGLIGNPTPFPQCSLAQFLTIVSSGTLPNNLCSPKTAVGVAMATVNEPNGLFGKPLATFASPVFSLEPQVGEPARFGFLAFSTPVFLDTSVRTGSDYGVTVHVSNISQSAAVIKSEVVFWGVPGDSRHDTTRGWGCLEAARELTFHSPCAPAEEANPPPLLALPTSCTGALQSNVLADSWADPTDILNTQSQPMSALDGCNRLPFTPSIQVSPDGNAAATPTGLNVDVHVPQDLVLNPTGLAEADVKDTTVALPAGVALNPAAADGLTSCSLAQIDLSSPAAASCPDASKVATVEVKTPLLPNPLIGSAYVAAQNANPFGSLIALYVVVEDPVSGVRVKLAGEVQPNPTTGQLVSSFKNTPQLPFEDFRLHFFGGQRAPLATPSSCGSYTTTASISPWSGNQSANSSSTFDVTSGPNGGSCQSPLPFSPTLTAGSTNLQASAFTPFTTTITRPDGQQSLKSVALHMPGGLSGILSGVPLCEEAQANAGTCASQSQIGETTVSVGLGADPFSVTGGRVYLTKGYGGAPFGLSIVNPAKAGPYDLGSGPCDCVVVRAKIEVDPVTAALTVSTDTQGPYAIPTILDGIPLEIQHVNVTINRPGFTFNPSNCSPLAIDAGLQSTEGATSNTAVPFQVTNCATLKFAPKFEASTAGQTSKANGASLHVKLTYPKAPFGTQANITSVKVDLPKQLPSRLTTLQKACTAAQFQANPAGCPAASVIGHAKAITPLLPVPLEGPAYFVSHGGEAFPSLIVVLQGYGVTVDLVGTTLIKKGITSSTFKTVPDVPVGSFELTLPQGKFSALAANGNLCKPKLLMPTLFNAQNGAVLKQSTKISVTGCPKAKKAKAKKKGKKASKKRGKAKK